MNPYQEGQRDARKWDRFGLEYFYPNADIPYERGWNAYMRAAKIKRLFITIALKILTTLAIATIIYLVLLWT